jgi:hypothetical protein
MEEVYLIGVAGKEEEVVRPGRDGNKARSAMCYCCFPEKVPMIFGCCIVGGCLRDLWGCFGRLRDPLIDVRPSFVTPSKIGTL